MVKEKLKPSHEAYALSLSTVNLLSKLAYRANDPKIGKTGNEYITDFFRNISADSDFPCFHIGLKVSIQSPHLKIIGFHFDESEGKSSFTAQNALAKSNEIQKIIDALTDEDPGKTRDELLLELKNEMLFGNSMKVGKNSGLKSQIGLRKWVASTPNTSVRKRARQSFDRLRSRIIDSEHQAEIDGAETA